jgi:hypothetical protein
MDEPQRIDRRDAIRWMLAAGATVSTLNLQTFGAEIAATGYGRDPKLLEAYKPGDFWPLTFSRDERQTVATLCDLIIPADERSPGAAGIGVPDFIDEWVSAPYPEQQSDRKTVLDGLAWLDTESRKRFKKQFVDLSAEQQRQICDDICYGPAAKAEFKTAARFFSKFRNLTVGGYYTTPQGWKNLQYIGNVPLTKFEGPPPEVLEYLKLT